MGRPFNPALLDDPTRRALSTLENNIQEQIGQIVVDVGIADFKTVHTQTSASSTWTIEHGLGGYPNVTTVEGAGGDVIVGDVEYTSTSQIVVTFSAAVSGVAYLS